VPHGFNKIAIRATNWLGDAVMSLPAIRAVRDAFPEAHVAVIARPWVADLYSREAAIDRVLVYPGRSWSFIRRLRAERFDCAILLQNAFEAALVARLAGIPRRIGYNRDGRGWLLTDAIPVPFPGEIPRHERFYYLELLRRSGIVDRLPECDAIRLGGWSSETGETIGISPGAAYGNAKRWLPERFAEAALRLGGPVAVFGSAAERALCEHVAETIRRGGGTARNYAGETTLAEFIEKAAACRLFLTNDSGAMHIASALGVPTVTVFGATDHTTTGPTGPLARVVREPVDCSPCLLRECPIDHRCMMRVTVEQVIEAALWTPDTNSSPVLPASKLPAGPGNRARG